MKVQAGTAIEMYVNMYADNNRPTMMMLMIMFVYGS